MKTAQRQKARARLPPQCAYCGAAAGLTLDHIIPRVYGGGNEFSNLQLLCGPYHVAKSKEVRHWHPAANRKASERLRKKLLAANEANAAVQSSEKTPEETP
ncbi:MAG: HNH endonuclease [Hymenobacter sp.]|nr:MAG: HNH endonuclease [Hymenobacter sp.]